MYTKSKMSRLASDELVRCAIMVAHDVQSAIEIASELQSIIDECLTDSDADYIYGRRFELGDFSDMKRGITRELKKYCA